MQDQRKEIEVLINQMKTLTHNAEKDVKAKELVERCEALNGEV